MLIACRLVLRRMSASEHAPAFHVQNNFMVLVAHLPSGSDQTDVRFGAHGARFQNSVFEAQDIVWENRLFPLKVFKTRRSQAGGILQKIRHSTLAGQVH